MAQRKAVGYGYSSRLDCLQGSQVSLVACLPASVSVPCFSLLVLIHWSYSPAERAAEERALHEQKLAKMETEMKMVFQQKVQEKEAKLKQSEEELYARHREMKDALEKQRLELEDKKRRLESGRPLTPTAEKNSVGDFITLEYDFCLSPCQPDQEKPFPPYVIVFLKIKIPPRHSRHI